jgi:hypothetical protein
MGVTAFRTGPISMPGRQHPRADHAAGLRSRELGGASESMGVTRAARQPAVAFGDIPFPFARQLANREKSCILGANYGGEL